MNKLRHFQRLNVISNLQDQLLKEPGGFNVIFIRDAAIAILNKIHIISHIGPISLRLIFNLIFPTKPESSSSSMVT